MEAYASEDPCKAGYQETRDLVLAAILCTLGFPMRGHCPAAVVFDAQQIYITLLKKGTGDLELCRSTFYFHIETKHPEFGHIRFIQIFRAKLLAILVQRLHRGDKAPDLPLLLERAKQDCDKIGVSQELYNRIRDLVDFAANFMNLTEVIDELARDPMLRFARDISTKKNALRHLVQPLNQETSVVQKTEFYTDPRR